MGNLVKVAGVQMRIVITQMEKNLNAMLQHASELAEDGVHLVVFPECALCGYCFDSLAEALPYAETLPGPSTDRITALCQEKNIYVVYGLLERDGDDLFNACALVGPQGLVGSYRKIHLPYLGIDRFTTPGNRPFEVFDAGGLRVGMNICYDGAFPESSRVMALQGADVIVLPTNWPPGAECTADFVINTRAMENHVYYLAINRIGTERGFPFIGKSRFCAPNGSLLDSADHVDPAMLIGEVNLDWVRNKHVIRIEGKHEINRFADRRPDMYELIATKPE